MPTKKPNQILPKGWTLARIQALIKYYDNQTDEEAVAEMEAAWRKQDALAAARKRDEKKKTPPTPKVKQKSKPQQTNKESRRPKLPEENET